MLGSLHRRTKHDILRFLISLSCPRVNLITRCSYVCQPNLETGFKRTMGAKGAMEDMRAKGAMEDMRAKGTMGDMRATTYLWEQQD